MSENPYAAPSAVVADVENTGAIEKAERGTRLVSAIVDGLVGIPIAILIFFGMSDATNPNFALIGFGMLLALGLLVVNIMLLHKDGQTIGKKLMKIKIVQVDGSRAGLGRTFGLRMIVNGLLSAIPFVGSIYGLVDLLFIFGEERRCVHDYIAGTIVIKA